MVETVWTTNANKVVSFAEKGIDHVISCLVY